MGEPEEVQCSAQSQGLLDLLFLKQPTERGSQVIVFLLESIEPLQLLCTGELWSSRLGQREMIPGMSLLDPLHLSTGSQLLLSILANGLEHHQARFAPWLRALEDQVVVQQLLHAIQHRRRAAPQHTAHGLHGLQRATAHEDREQPEEPLLVW